MAVLSVKKGVVIIVGLIVLILISIVFLFFTNQLPTHKNSSLTVNLNNYVSFREKLTTLNFNNDQLQTLALNQLNILENPNTTAADKYGALKQAAFLASKAYDSNHNPEIYSFINQDSNTFAKENFKSYYKPSDFTVSCEDPSCSNLPQPKAVLDIISEINSLQTVAQYDKNTTIDSLKNCLYFQPISKTDKVIAYLNVADQINTNDQFISAGVNKKFADEIKSFLKETYPNEYSQVETAIKNTK
jgi:hypothetical protein